MLLSILIFTVCGKKEKSVTLTPDQPAYVLGKTLSPILSVLSPSKMLQYFLNQTIPLSRDAINKYRFKIRKKSIDS
jgi:hypothetical protein